ncbi:Serine/threonine-protein kinase haspin [Cladorrhinum sp. PSN259]|nr:Serine/threonine-protein kinase haspin [Cladorrhinum sp. PSN259]
MRLSPRKYGKSTRNTRAEQLFAELPKSPIKKTVETQEVVEITEHFASIILETDTEERTITIQEKIASSPSSACSTPSRTSATSTRESTPPDVEEVKSPKQNEPEKEAPTVASAQADTSPEEEPEEGYSQYSTTSSHDLRILTWDDICPFGDQIAKIAEASYAEVYRITNSRGTSIIKCVRLESPIKPQTKAQERSGLVDEEPHSPESMLGELKISEWLADIPGFVVYKERYIVRGKAPKSLLETHQAFQRREKRKDLDRLQFYPSPSRYLDDTEFLVVELGDAGTALEDFPLGNISQVWDIFLHTAIALARADDLIQFEHRDLHEGNLCVRRVHQPTTFDPSSATHFGYSGLEITILDYGLSRASFPDRSDESIFYDLESDLSVFTSTHAPQCKVYRQMRSYIIRGDRINCLPPTKHNKPYDTCSTTKKPISWQGHFPYTNVLWLAYIYNYLISNFKGDPKELKQFKKHTRELKVHLDPEAPKGVLSFPCAGDVVRFVVEAGWIEEAQLMEDGGDGSFLTGCGGWDDEGVSIVEEKGREECLRRSGRRREG